MAQGYGGVPAGPLAAYLSVRDRNEQRGSEELQQVGAVQGLLAKMQQQQQERQFQSELQALGPNPTPEQIAPLAMRYRKPELAVSMLQATEQRKSRELIAEQNRIAQGQRTDEMNRLRGDISTAQIQSREDIAARDRALRGDIAAGRPA